jgi:hypothetical protein
LFKSGQIIYFQPFYFKNGNTSKNKYFVVLKIISDKIIIASLPSSISKAPSLVNITHGCINNEERCFNCYVFQKHKVVCSNGFYFEMDTFIYGNEVEDYEIDTLSQVYAIEGIDFEHVGNLTKEEFDALYICLKESSSTKRKIKKLL